MSYSFEYETELDLGSGDEEEIQVEIEIKVSFEKNYGADADGNRGIPAHFCELESLKAWRAAGIEITDREALARIEKDYDKNHSIKYEQEAVEAYEER